MNFKTIIARLGIICAVEAAVWMICQRCGYPLPDSALEAMVVVPATLALGESVRLLFVRDRQYHEELVRRLEAEDKQPPAGVTRESSAGSTP